VLFGENGAVAAATAGTLIIDMSTISPRLTVELARRTHEAKLHFIDAPMSGGQAGAVEARLSIMVGGEPSDVERALPILQKLGKTITHMGPVGAGQATKLANQIAVAVNQLGVAEALSFARAVGLDADLTRQVITGGAGSSWAMQNSATKIIARDFRPGFSIDLLQKDLRLVIETAQAASTPVLGSALVHQLYSGLQRNGGGKESTLALIKALERLAGETDSADT
jgi:3-hydroxyisobutyrate dehydrogenase